MNARNLIIGKKPIKKLTDKMTLINDDGWESRYLNKTDKSEWIKIDLDSVYHDTENLILYNLPKPTQSELIKILVKEKKINIVSAISCLINYFEFDNDDNLVEFREELINELEKIIEQKDFKITNLESKRLKTIIYDSELNHSRNQREYLGKNKNKVEKDFLYYKNIAQRAEKIIAIINS